MFVTQEEADEADAFSDGGPIVTEDENEGDVRGYTLESTGNATEVVVYIELIAEINPTVPLSVQVEFVPDRFEGRAVLREKRR